MNFQLTDEQKLTQKTARKFAENELAPGVVERDEKKIWPKEGVAKMAELGFLGMMADPKMRRANHELGPFSFSCCTTKGT